MTRLFTFSAWRAKLVSFDIFFNFYIDIPNGNQFYIESDKKTYKKSAKLENKLKHMFCFHQTMFTKISLMKKYKFNTNFKIAGDYDFILKCAMNNYNFKLIYLAKKT